MRLETAIRKLQAKKGACAICGKRIAGVTCNLCLRKLCDLKCLNEHRKVCKL